MKEKNSPEPLKRNNTLFRLFTKKNTHPSMIEETESSKAMKKSILKISLKKLLKLELLILTALALKKVFLASGELLLPTVSNSNL
jgi:hypothetical protein